MCDLSIAKKKTVKHHFFFSEVHLIRQVSESKCVCRVKIIPEKAFALEGGDKTLEWPSVSAVWKNSTVTVFSVVVGTVCIDFIPHSQLPSLAFLMPFLLYKLCHTCHTHYRVETKKNSFLDSRIYTLVNLFCYSHTSVSSTFPTARLCFFFFSPHPGAVLPLERRARQTINRKKHALPAAVFDAVLSLSSFFFPQTLHTCCGPEASQGVWKRRVDLSLSLQLAYKETRRPAFSQLLFFCFPPHERCHTATECTRPCRVAPRSSALTMR